jgi:hypothetical protein
MTYRSEIIAVVGKVHVPQLHPRFVQDIAEAQRNKLGVGCEPLVVGDRQRVEEVVLVRAAGHGCGHKNLRDASPSATVNI